VGRPAAPDSIPEFVASDQPAPDTYAAIFNALEASSRHVIGPMRPRLLVIPIHDDAGSVTGGLWGYTLFRWLHVQLLFVPEARRGHGIGSTLMALAEAEARDRGCIAAQVSTFSFQAAPFYQKLGYTQFGQLHDYPPGHSLLHLHKQFAGSSGDRDHKQALARARALAAKGEDEAAKQAYVDVLRIDPTQFTALNEIGALSVASGHRSGARTAYAQAVRFHPGNPVGRVNLGNLLLEDGDAVGARTHYEAAVSIDPNFPEAHQGMARVLTELGDPAAETHWLKGFADHAIVTKPYRGSGPAVPLVLLVAARGGNIPTRHWIDDRRFAVTAIYTDFHDPAQTLPPHVLVVNAIGDADLCDRALACAEAMLAGGTAPVINPPALVRMTRRADNARRFAHIDGVIAPEITVLSRATMRDGCLRFPLLLRAPGFHTGRHFAYVQNDDALAKAAANLPGDELLAIQYLNARGRDGMARKYRVMFIGGRLYPLHLAISADWKVHYFTAAMEANPAHRDEESHVLNDMPAVLGRHRADPRPGLRRCRFRALAGRVRPCL
jgi:GNAT superfamily N-acetyltransferase